MPNRNYQRGRAFEYKVRKWYEGQGWFVLRAAGSKGPADLVIIRNERAGDGPLVSLVQCKLGPVSVKEREKLAYWRARLGVHATLATPATWKVKRGCRPFATEAV